MSEARLIPAIEKRAWPAGPWQTEPDRVDFVHAGYACLLLRHPRHGYWCGYVALDPTHPFYGQDWTDLPSLDAAPRALNYSDRCDGAICHVPEPGMPDDVWWLGCDFGHAFDFAPGMVARELAAGLDYPDCLRKTETYRDLRYVRRGIEAMADELRALAKTT